MKSPRPWKFMEASSPGARPKERGLFSSIRFRFFWLNRNKRRQDQIWWSLWVWTTIFIFYIMVRFLLLTFDPAGPSFMEYNLPVKVTLPSARMTDEYHRGLPLVLIGEDRVVLVVQSSEGVEKVNMELVDFPDSLVLGLEELKDEFRELYPNQQFSRRVTIAADHDIPFSKLRSVMDACQAAGYDNFDLAVSNRPFLP